MNERFISVWNQGIYLGSRTEGKYAQLLYHMGRFFCEVWYSPASTDIVLMQSFTSETLPESYLEMIELPRL